MTHSSVQPTRSARGPAIFALIGAAGYVAPRHLQAMRDTGCQLVAAVDPKDSVGILDRFFSDVRFFTEIERFDRYLERRRRDPETAPVEFMSICSPNYLHDAHVRLALRLQAHAVCEKPLVINPWNLDQLRELEQEHGRRVYTVLQLRKHPAAQALKASLQQQQSGPRHQVTLTYVTRRGPWYHVSWKGNTEKSGGLAVNIGIHFFDLLVWFFGGVQESLLHVNRPERMAGRLELERASVQWFLSVDGNDLPAGVRQAGGSAYRSITVDGQEIDLSPAFHDLHTEIYKDVLDGGGYGIEDARLAIEALYQIRSHPEVAADFRAHPMVFGKLPDGSTPSARPPVDGS